MNVDFHLDDTDEDTVVEFPAVPSQDEELLCCDQATDPDGTTHIRLRKYRVASTDLDAQPLVVQLHFLADVTPAAA